MRRFKRGAPEESLAPGESLELRKGRTKRFRLVRVDQAQPDFLDTVRAVLLAVTAPRTGRRVNLARVLAEERE
jgi:hypothetical protein